MGFTVVNGFDIPIYLSTMLLPINKTYVLPGAFAQLTFTQDDVCIVQAAQTGSFMCSIVMQTEGEAITVNYMLLTSPNDIGPVPQPTATMLVPPDSPRILVGCSTLADGKIVVREQFWDRQGDSCTLAPGEKKTITTTVTTGRQETSTHESTLAASLGMNANVGFGPFSASVSSSLSMTSRSFQQVTVSEQNTAYFADELTNPYTDQACLVLRWQLTDVITIFQPEGAPCGSVIIGESPIITEIYGINALPTTLPMFELAEEDHALISY
ncbi:hypothetical protein ATY76_27380 [Rhizobium sp. R339]|nr:hypothetical protein ATY76_27380 [Rhizobium sp. R339]